MTTHPVIDRLAALSSEELTVADVAEVLGNTNRKAVDKLIQSGDLEVLQGGARVTKATDPLGRPIRHRYTIAAAAILTLLVKRTTGDKAVLLEAIRARFPHHLPLCERLAQGKPAEPAPLPANVIPMHGRPKRQAKAKPADYWHPNQLALFPEHSPGQASA